MFGRDEIKVASGLLPLRSSAVVIEKSSLHALLKPRTIVPLLKPSFPPMCLQGLLFLRSNVPLLKRLSLTKTTIIYLALSHETNALTVLSSSREGLEVNTNKKKRLHISPFGLRSSLTFAGLPIGLFSHECDNKAVVAYQPNTKMKWGKMGLAG